MEKMLYNADCMSLFERMDGGCLDMIYLDPPWHSQLGGDAANPEATLDAYLAFMSRVAQQAHRVLKDTGSVVIHLDPFESHLVRAIFDVVFGRGNFRSEFIVPIGRRSRMPGIVTRHDTYLFYSKSDEFCFLPPTRHLRQDEISERYRQVDERGPYRRATLFTASPVAGPCFEWQGVRPPSGRRWIHGRAKLDALLAEGKIDFEGRSPSLKVHLVDQPEVEVGSVWSDLSDLKPPSSSVPHQQHDALIERIIRISTMPASIVFDPMCGSGTFLIAAHKLGRRWIGCDSSPSAIANTLARLQAECRIVSPGNFSSFERADVESLPVVHDFYARIEPFRKPASQTFHQGEFFAFEEGRHVELKEIKGGQPANTIKNTVDEYVISYLNTEGGQIFWGITDDRRVCGVTLSSKERDEVKKLIADKLSSIEPCIPATAFRVQLHPVYSEGVAVDDCFVIEVSVPAADTNSLYYTASGETWIRTDSGRKKLRGTELQTEILRRFGI